MIPVNKDLFARKQVLPLPEINGSNLKMKKMKKLKMGLMAFALLIGIGAAFASKSVNHHKHQQSSLYWYAVSGGKTVGSYEYDDTKSNVIGEQPCDDSVTPVCLFGSTNSAVANGTSIGSPDAAHSILKQNQ